MLMSDLGLTVPADARVYVNLGLTTEQVLYHLCLSCGLIHSATIVTGQSLN